MPARTRNAHVDRRLRIKLETMRWKTKTVELERSGFYTLVQEGHTDRALAIQRAHIFGGNFGESVTASKENEIEGDLSL